MVSELVLDRFFSHDEATIGALKDVTSKAPKLIGFTCEDQKQPGAKVMHETRIPAGRYRLVINRVLTDLTKKYQKNYSWFKYHIMLENVPGFTGIYIHIGNHDDHTSGCIILGDILTNISLKANDRKIVLNSTICFERFYRTYYNLLEAGNTVYLTIKDER